MTVIPVTLNNGSAIPAPAKRLAENNPSFKSHEMEKDSFVKRPKESWIHKYRDIIGFFAGGIVGDIIWQKKLVSKVENMKNMTRFKSGAAYVAFSVVTGYIGSLIAMQFGKKN